VLLSTVPERIGVALDEDVDERLAVVADVADRV